MDTVEARTRAAGFGPLVARVPHPLGRIHAAIAWAYFLLPAVFVLVGLLLTLTGPQWERGPEGWAVGLLGIGVAAGLAWSLAKRAHGHVHRQAFYLYPEGYLLTSPFGRVVRVEPWRNVTRVEILPIRPRVMRQRIVCEFRHVKGRTVRLPRWPAGKPSRPWPCACTRRPSSERNGLKRIVGM